MLKFYEMERIGEELATLLDKAYPGFRIHVYPDDYNKPSKLKVISYVLQDTGCRGPLTSMTYKSGMTADDFFKKINHRMPNLIKKRQEKLQSITTERKEIRNIERQVEEIFIGLPYSYNWDGQNIQIAIGKTNVSAAKAIAEALKKEKS